MDNLKSQDLLALIDLIYVTIGSPNQWPALFNRVDHYLASHVGLSEIDSTEDASYVIYPHLHRALHYNQKLEEANHQRHASLRVIDSLPVGIIEVDADLIILSENQFSKHQLKMESFFVRKGAQLVPTTKEIKEKVNSLILSLLNKDATLEESSLLLTQATDNENNLNLYAMCNRGNISQSPTFTFIISHSGSKPKIASQTLAKLYSLTPAESKLVNHLVNGSHSLTDIADKLKLSKHTVRSHFKNILAKTNTHSQAELLKRIFGEPTIWINEDSQPEIRSASANLVKSDIKNKTAIFRFGENESITYNQYGAHGGKPILFCHGYFHSHWYWQQRDQDLKKRGLWLIVPDRPGFGGSSLFSTDKVAINSYVLGLKQLLKEHKISEIDVLAESTGTKSAITFTIAADEQVSKVNLISPFPDAHYHVNTTTLFSQWLLIKTYQKLPNSARQRVSKLLLEKVSQDPCSYFDRLRSKLSATDLLATQDNVFLELVRQTFIHSYESPNSHYFDDFTQINSPWNLNLGACSTSVNIWHGEDNSLFSPAISKGLAKDLPNGKYIGLTDAGQYLLHTHWEKILSRL